ncbi:MAG: MBL fold metallo-hydrolase [Chloroflexi bacterium]|nr:MBL fold metallo-hydrolase [Chloroflexota bacterium]
MSVDKVQVGNVEIISVVDTPFQLLWQIFSPSVEYAEIEKYKDLYPESYGDDAMLTHAGTYVLRSEGKTILCDTGLGPGPTAMLGGVVGKLLDNLAAAGVPADSVDIVTHTHLHVDHVGWNVNADGQPNFANARYLAPQEDWDLFGSNLPANPHMSQVIPLKDLGRLDIYSGEHAVTSELTLIPSPGHTPGHHSLMVSSSGERAILMGDMAHHPSQVEEIEWCTAFDLDHPTVIENRRKLFDQAEAEGLISAFCHFPQPFGKLVRLDGKRVFQGL